MRKGIAAICGLCLVGGLLAGTPSPHASAKAGTIDKELLGIRLLQSYKAVLQLYGQPTRIFRADEGVYLGKATDANGRETGGISYIGDPGQGGGGGFPGGGGGRMPGGMPGMPGSGGMMPGMSGMPGSGGMMPGMPGSGGMGMPRMGGKGGDDEGGMPGGAPAMGGASSTSGKATTFADSGGFTWVYYYPHDEVAYIFFFNADGRVEMISEHGRYKGKPTSKGIHLGDPAKSVYSTYGWPDTVEEQSTALVLNYNLKHHVLFNTLNGKVSAITVILKESSYPRLTSTTGGGGGGGGRMPGMGGGRMPGGMRGMPGSGGMMPGMPRMGGKGGGNGAD